jgi:hypothetical protein
MNLFRTSRDLCDQLNRDSLPRAVAHFGRDVFVGWNKSFLRRTGYSEESLRSLQPTRSIFFGMPSGEVTGIEKASSSSVLLRHCVFQCAADFDFAPGQAAQKDHQFTLLILDIANREPRNFELGKRVGREEERTRVLRLFHDGVSWNLLAAAFIMHGLEDQLSAEGLPQAGIAAKAAELMGQAIENVQNLWTAEWV